jgi:hypothetical protein
MRYTFGREEPVRVIQIEGCEYMLFPSQSDDVVISVEQQNPCDGWRLEYYPETGSVALIFFGNEAKEEAARRQGEPLIYAPWEGNVAPINVDGVLDVTPQSDTKPFVAIYLPPGEERPDIVT